MRYGSITCTTMGSSIGVHLRWIGLAGSLLFVASLAVISVCVTAYPDDSMVWENFTNITDISSVQDFELNSNDDTIYILMGNSIEEWALEQPIRYAKYDRAWGEIYDLEWSDHMGQMAIIHSGSMMDFPTIWDSKLILLDGNMNIVESLAPWGNLTNYKSSDMIDIEWNPKSSWIAILHDDGVLRIIDVTDGSLVLQRDLGTTTSNIRWNPQGTLIGSQLDELVVSNTIPLPSNISVSAP